jgi:hypothetical protein
MKIFEKEVFSPKELMKEKYIAFFQFELMYLRSMKA